MTDCATHAIYPSLRGKAVVITGGASGIGASMVEAFACQGARVFFLDIDRLAGAALAERLQGRHRHDVGFLPCDLLELDQLSSRLAEIADRAGAVDVLINNAARDDRHGLEAVTPELWDELMAVNLRHQFFACKDVLPAMRNRGGGAIINLGSVAFLRGLPGMPVYVVAKAGVVGMTRALARDWGPFNVRINCIIPGWVMTERQRRLWVTEEAFLELSRPGLTPRWLLPEDVARLALFLASDDARMCSGQEFVVEACGA